jgi:hypothetical protein
MSKLTPLYVTSDKHKDLIPRFLADLNDICDCTTQHNTTQAVHKLRVQTFRNTLFSPDSFLSDLDDKFHVDLPGDAPAAPLFSPGRAVWPRIVLLSVAGVTAGWLRRLAINKSNRINGMWTYRV